MQLVAGRRKIALLANVAVDAEVDPVRAMPTNSRRVSMSACLAWSAMLPSG
jgi:hypothetical protein